MRALLLPLLLAGCPKLPDPTAALKQSLRVGYTAGSHVHAFQSYSFVYAFARANALGLIEAVKHLDAHGQPLIDKLAGKGMRPRLTVQTRTTADGITAYGVDLTVHTKSGATTLPGSAGTDPGRYHAASARIAAASGLPVTEIETGHGAWFNLTRQLTGLDAEAVSLRRHLFALSVLTEQVSAGEQADWFDPTRPPEQTLEDTALAMTLLQDDIERVRGDQAALLALFLLANHVEKPGVSQALTEELQRTRADTEAWLASHPQPALQDFGVGYNVPNPQTIKAAVDEQLGVVGSAVKVARGLSTGDIPKTLDGIAGLVPKDTKARAIADGAAAISKGDIKGTLGAIADLGGPDTRAGQIAGRLEAVAGLASRLP